MIDTERIELLQQVARVAPKDLLAEYSEGVPGTDSPAELILLGTTNPHPNSRPLRQAVCERTLSLLNDEDDASACFAMLDAMRNREAGLTSLVVKRRRMEGKDDISELHRVRAVLNELTWRTLSGEAVARAFVQVFGGGNE